MLALFAHIPTALLIAAPLLLLISTKLVSTVMSVVAVFVILLHPKRGAILRGIIQSRALYILIALILVWPLLSVVWSIEPSESLSDWLRIALIMLVGAILWVSANRFTAPAAARLVEWMALSCIAVQCFIALETVAGIPVLIWVTDGLGGDHYKLVMQYLNRFANAMTLLSLVLIYGLLKKQMRVLALELFAVTTITLLSLDSNSAMLGLVAGCGIWLLMHGMPKVTMRLLSMLVPLGFLILPALTYALLTLPELDSVREHFASFSAGRMPIWNSLIANSWDHWQLGWGISTTHLIPYSPDLPNQITFNGPPLHPHHSALQVLLELGAIGLLLFTAALCLVLKQCARLPVGLGQEAAVAMMIAYLATGLSSFSIWANWWIGMAWLAAILWRYLGSAR
ncbi:MAG: O-antigen ligase family protein [Alphaproteobacteria bacterium]|nr:O-antigen ligase family protein [Alphaproteobacteria bacterium]